MNFKEWLLQEAFIDAEEFRNKIDSNLQFSLVMDENGQIESIFNYENGLRTGWQRRYLENGAILYEVNQF